MDYNLPRNMDMNFISKLSEIQSFTELQKIYEKWINDGVINEKSQELILSYQSLITYPSIYLRKGQSEQEITAIKECYKIVTRYAKDKLKEDMNSNDSNLKAATALIIMPPEKFILTQCNEFYLLRYLIEGLYPNYTDSQFASINGDDYAKVWQNIFARGYHFEQTKKHIDYDFDHLNSTLITISKMNLSPQCKSQMSPENIKPRFAKYYNDKSLGSGTGGSGCMLVTFVLFASSLLAAYLI